MTGLEILYLFFTFTLALSGLGLVALSSRSYIVTKRKEMLWLSIGFTLIVGATVGTASGGFVTNFRNPLTLLSVNYLLTTIGYLFILYSLK